MEKETATILTRQISIVWSLEDVKEHAAQMGYDLTDEQSSEILEITDKYHDASIGINWDVIAVHIGDYCTENGIEQVRKSEDEDEEEG